MKSILHECPDTAWGAEGPGAPTHGVEEWLESGGVIVFPHLPFALSEAERRFLDPRFADGKAKNISLRAGTDEQRGATGTDTDRAELRQMLLRYRSQAESLVARLFPHYRGHVVTGNASYRPIALQGRARSWRQDDTRLHVDAFPSNPTRGTRLLRIFSNLNPAGEPRRWRVGEPFEDFARRFLPAIGRPLPGSAALLRALHVTKSQRSDYDHYMLQLHDRVKADLDYQRQAPQQAVDFAPGTTWVVFSDQVLHAAMGGQFMMEQTFMLPAAGLKQPASAPLAVLERMLGRPLLV
jgi:hypothetical protein